MTPWLKTMNSSAIGEDEVFQLGIGFRAAQIETDPYRHVITDEDLRGTAPAPQP
jgi:hypothetical protein